MKCEFRDFAFGARSFQSEGTTVHEIECLHRPTGKSVTRMGLNYNVVRLRAYNAVRKMVEECQQDDPSKESVG